MAGFLTFCYTINLYRSEMTMKKIVNVRNALLFYSFFLVSSSIFPASLHATPIIPPEESLPKPGELALTSEKDIPQHIVVARQYLKAGKFVEVVTICERVAGMQKDNVEAMALQAAAYKGLGDDEKYEATARLARKLAPESPALSLAMATTYAVLKDPGKEEDAYRKGLESAVDKPELYMGLGAFYAGENRLEEAANQYKQVLAEKNLAAKYFLNASFALCRIELQQKAYDQVIKRAGAITELYPPLPQGYVFLASANLAKNAVPQAIETYEKLLKVNPETPVPFQELALIYEDKLGDHAKALGYAKEAVDKFSDDPKSHDILGWIFFNQREYPEAQKRFELAAGMGKNNPQYLYHLGLSHLKAGDKEKAKKAFEEGLKFVDEKDDGKFAGELKKRIGECK